MLAPKDIQKFGGYYWPQTQSYTNLSEMSRRARLKPVLTELTSELHTWTYKLGWLLLTTETN